MANFSHPLPGRLWIVRLSETISSRIKRGVEGWPPQERERLGDQVIRAIDSVGANLSEGYVRMHVRERLHFISLAQGSVEETLFHVRRARESRLMAPLEAFTLSELLYKLSRAILSFKDEVRKGWD